MRCCRITAPKPGSTWRASTSVGTRAGCTGRRRSATRSIRNPTPESSRRCSPISMRRGAIVPRPETVAAGGPALSELLAALPVGILVIDPDRRIARVNAACEQLLNLSERVLVGQRLDDLLALPGPARPRRTGHALAAVEDRKMNT